MEQYFYANKNYKQLVGYIAKSKRKDKGLYDKAKTYLRQIEPALNDVELETQVLWDVREYFKTVRKK